MKKILICIPNTGMVHSQFMFSLLRLKRPAGYEITWAVTEDSLIYHARNNFVETAIKGNYDYVLMVDSDMVLPEDTLIRLLSHGKDFVSGFCFKRRYPYTPCVLTKCRIDPDEVVFEQMQEWDDGLSEIEGVGSACVLIKTSVFKDIAHNWYTPNSSFSEDYMFCIRARESGYKIYVDTTLVVGHIGSMVVTDQQYIAVMTHQLKGGGSGASQEG